MHTAAVYLVTNPCTTILHGTFHAPTSPVLITPVSYYTWSFSLNRK